MNLKVPTPPDAGNVVLTFLESVGRRSEAELYLKLFRELPKESFAIIAAEAAVIRYAAGSLAEQLRFLRELGLLAPVAVGLLEPETAEKAAARLAKRCADMGAVLLDAREAGTAARVREELHAENLPILCLAGEADEPLSARFEFLGALAAQLGTRKLVVLRRRGGLGRSARSTPLSAGERGISVVNLRTDLAALSAPRALPSDDAELLGHLATLLARPDCSRTVASVTSPLNLLRELFTVKGAGTLIKVGSAIERHDGYESLDEGRLHRLLESSFGRQLRADFFRAPPLVAYVEENYRGAAILEASPIAPYLTKFAVDRVAQGEGLGRDLWEVILREQPRLFWRARADNPIAGWYVTLCDGLHRTPSWTVFWRGISASEVPAVVEDALARPEDFGPRTPE